MNEDYITITDTVRVSDENIKDMMGTAAYGAITYWATSPEEEDFKETEARGAAWTIKEQEDGEVYHLTNDRIREAFATLASSTQSMVGDMVHGYFRAAVRDADEDGIDTGHIDADAADVLVQVACFGKVVYG